MTLLNVFLPEIIGRDWPENRTDPTRFGGETAFLTVGPEETGATISDASSIQQTVRAIPLWPSFWRVKGVIGGAEQGSIGLQGKSGSWKTGSQTRGVPSEGVHTTRFLRARRRVRARWRVQERIRLTASQWETGAAPVPDADSTSIDANELGEGWSGFAPLLPSCAPHSQEPRPGQNDDAGVGGTPVAGALVDVLLVWFRPHPRPSNAGPNDPTSQPSEANAFRATRSS